MTQCCWSQCPYFTFWCWFN